MSVIAKFLLTLVLVAVLLIPGVGELAALPVIAMLGVLWGIAPTTS